MSASHAPALDAIAFQLAAALERYEQDVGRMVDTWLDMDLYRDVSEQVEQIRMYTAALPQLSVHWVELLIAHAELVHFLWRAQHGDGRDAREQIGAVRDHHAACVTALHNRCLRMMARGAGPRDLA